MPDLDAPVIRSGSTDVFANLALEDYLFRRLQPGERRLFLWRNRDAVVIGRYQNPWLECDLAALRRDGVALARRQSGGGTVWHDTGNLCFTFLGSRSGFDRQQNILSVSRALASLGITVETNARLDLLLGGKKISGSAFRETGTRSFHHGTILIRSDLAKLSRYLNGDPALAEAKGIKSVRSAVANLGDRYPDCTPEDVERALAAEFAPHDAAIVTLNPDRDPLQKEIAASEAQLRGRDWLLGASPPFKRRWNLRVSPQETVSVVLSVAGGRIESVTSEDGSILPSSAAGLGMDLVGREYADLADL